jgi:hypothetical protein
LPYSAWSSFALVDLPDAGNPFMIIILAIRL